MSSTVAGIAGGTIRPFRVVYVSTAADNTLLEASAVTQQTVCGVTDGSTLQFDSSSHATTGLPVSLQDGIIQYITAGAAITRGARVEVTTAGKVITETTTTGNAAFAWVALESAVADGAVIRCVRALNATKLS